MEILTRRTNSLAATAGESSQRCEALIQTRVNGPPKVTYYIHSSVIGEMVSEVSAQGAKERSFVFAGGQIMAIQSTAGGQFASWEHYDASGSSYRPTNSQGGVGIGGEMDPMGADAGIMKPLTWPQLTSPGKLEPYYGIPELNSATQGCTLDRVPIPCDIFNSLMNNDAIQVEYLVPDEKKAPPKPRQKDQPKPPPQTTLTFKTGDVRSLGLGIFAFDSLTWNDEEGGWDLTEEMFTTNPQDTRPRQELTTCQKFYRRVQQIADRAKSVKDFLDEFARTFTSARSSDPADMIAANVVTPPGHPANQFNSNDGIRDEFRLPTDYPGQIRHFTAAFIASAALGAFGEGTMNERENPNDADGQTDLAVNRLAFDIRRELEGRWSVGPDIALIKRNFAKQIRERFCTG